MGDVFIPYPFLALLPAAFFVGVWYILKKRILIVSGVAWFLYAVLEILNYYRITCTGECNIRVDLLLIYPILIILSGVALVIVALRLVRSYTKR